MMGDGSGPSDVPVVDNVTPSVNVGVEEAGAVEVDGVTSEAGGGIWRPAANCCILATMSMAVLVETVSL